MSIPSDFSKVPGFLFKVIDPKTNETKGYLFGVEHSAEKETLQMLENEKIKSIFDKTKNFYFENKTRMVNDLEEFSDRNQIPDKSEEVSEEQLRRYSANIIKLNQDVDSESFAEFIGINLLDIQLKKTLPGLDYQLLMKAFEDKGRDALHSLELKDASKQEDAVESQDVLSNDLNLLAMPLNEAINFITATYEMLKDAGVKEKVPDEVRIEKLQKLGRQLEIAKNVIAKMPSNHEDLQIKADLAINNVRDQLKDLIFPILKNRDKAWKAGDTVGFLAEQSKLDGDFFTKERDESDRDKQIIDFQRNREVNLASKVHSLLSSDSSGKNTYVLGLSHLVSTNKFSLLELLKARGWIIQQIK